MVSTHLSKIGSIWKVEAASMTNKFKQTNKTLQKITTYDLDLKKTSSSPCIYGNNWYFDTWELKRYKNIKFPILHLLASFV